MSYIYCRGDRSVHRCRKYIDLKFGDRRFEAAFHPFHIYFFRTARHPIYVKHSLVLLHENLADQFLQRSSKRLDFCFLSAWIEPQSSDF